jgi:serine/threonine protein kinase/Tol biopolymer transport system component
VPESKEFLPLPELEALERIDAICVQFERAWQKEEVPSLEEHLAQGLSDDRDSLLFELLMIELSHRQRRGEDWKWDQYQRRFEADRDCLDAVAEQLERYSSATTDGHDRRNSREEPQLPLRIRYVGNYEILEEIARGGMGVVFKARQTRLNRLVALKMLLGSSLATPTAIRRFHHEARTAARLNHPRIVPIHEIGQFEGHPWFTMDYIPGPSLDGEVREGPLEPSRAAQLVRQIAEAVQFAHDQGVLHRDLKPANILLDSEGGPLITDFGLAKLNREPGPERLETLTATGQVVGTPSFMSPEQATGRLGNVSVQTDVWALGGVLYACLTARPPFAAATAVDTLLQVMNHEPVEPRELNPSVPRDLENICLKCLSKEPRHRYSTAKALAEDLERFENGRSVLARPVSIPTKLWRWSKRNPAMASLSLLSVLLLVVGTVVSGSFAIQARNRANELEASGKELKSVLTFKQRILAEMQWSVYKSRLYPMKASWEDRDIGRLEKLLAESIPNDDEFDFRNWEWHFFDTQVRNQSRPIAQRSGEDRWIYLVSNHDFSLLALRRKGGVVDVVSRVTGKLISTIPATKQQFLAWHPSLNHLAIPTGNNQLEVWDVELEERLMAFQTGNDETTMDTRGIEWSPEGRRLALGGFRRIDLFSLDDLSHRKLRNLPAWTPLISWHDDGDLIGCGGVGWIGLFDLRTDELLWKDLFPGQKIREVEWNPSGTTLAMARSLNENGVVLYDLSGKKSPIPSKDTHCYSFRWSNDGRTLMSVGNGQRIEEIEIESGRLLTACTAHDSPIHCLEWDSQDGKVVSLDGIGQIRETRWPALDMPKIDLWENQPVANDRLQDDDFPRQVVWRPGHPTILAVRSNRQVWIVDLTQRAVIRRIQPGGIFEHFAWHPNQPKLLTYDRSGTVKIWDTSDGSLLHRLESCSSRYNRIAGWSPDGKHIYAASGQYWKPDTDEEIEIWDAVTRERVAGFGNRAKRVLTCWSPVDDRLAMIPSKGDAVLKIVDINSGDVVITSDPIREEWHDSIAFHPRGTSVAIGCTTGKLVLINASSGELMYQQPLPGSSVTDLRWCPDGTRLVAITSFQNLVIMDGATGEILVELDSLGELRGCDWSPSGDDLAVVNRDGLLRILSSRHPDQNRTIRPKTQSRETAN